MFFLCHFLGYQIDGFACLVDEFGTNRFDRERARKAAAHRRAVLRLESQIAGHLRNLQEIQMKLTEETEKMKAAVTELLNLRKVR